MERHCLATRYVLSALQFHFTSSKDANTECQRGGKYVRYKLQHENNID